MNGGSRVGPRDSAGRQHSVSDTQCVAFAPGLVDAENRGYRCNSICRRAAS